MKPANPTPTCTRVTCAAAPRRHPQNAHHARRAPPPPTHTSPAPRAPAPHIHIARAAAPPHGRAVGAEGVKECVCAGRWGGGRAVEIRPGCSARTPRPRNVAQQVQMQRAGAGGGVQTCCSSVFFACSGKGGAPRSRTDRGCTRRRAAGNGGSVSAAPRAGGGGGRRGHCKLVRRGSARRARARECARERALVAGIRAHLLFGGLGDGDEHERIYGGAEAVFFGSIYGSI